MIRSFLVWGFTWLYMAVAALVCLPWVALSGRLGLVYAAARLGLRLLLWLAGVRVVEHGREVLTPELGGAVLFMANHQSNLDPPILLARLPGFISFLAKRELFKVPVLGTVARVGGLIPVDRSDRAAAQGGIARAAAAIRAGRPFLIFPEGTRSPDGSLLPFKKGAFYLAEQAGAPVIPVTIVGSGELMPKGQMRIRPGTVHLYYHAPVCPGDYAGALEPRAAMAEAVRTRIASALPGPPTSLSGRPV